MRISWKASGNYTQERFQTGHGEATTEKHINKTDRTQRQYFIWYNFTNHHNRNVKMFQIAKNKSACFSLQGFTLNVYLL